MFMLPSMFRSFPASSLNLPLALSDRPGHGWSQPGPGGRHPPRLEVGLVPASQDCQESGGGRPGQSTHGDGDGMIDAAIYYNDKMINKIGNIQNIFFIVYIYLCQDLISLPHQV